MAIAIVGLGSNLSDPENQLRSALRELDELPGGRCIGHSSLYRSRPLTLKDAPPQPDYINAVAALDTDREPDALLEQLQGLEARHHRVRGERRWGPRTLDLDLLLYDRRRIRDPELTVPHPGLYERNFVLYPLAELLAACDRASLASLWPIADADFVVPGQGSLARLLAQCDTQGLVRIGPG